MPKFTLDLTPAATAKLQDIATAYNKNNGTELTVLDWLNLHVRELAIQDQLMRAADDLRQQADMNAQAALQAERDRLLAGV